MRLALLIQFLFLSLALNAQHVSNVYYNFVNSDSYVSDSLQWSNISKVDWTISVDWIGEYPLIYTGGERVYTLTQNLVSGDPFQKWIALDSKGETCWVSIGNYGDLKYMQIQYTDMGWCNIFD
jgi:hypothetical protein